MTKWANALLASMILAAAGCVEAATMTFDPYVPGEGLTKLAAELNLPPSDILLDRRCVYTKTDHWMARTSVRNMSTCTLVLTPDRVILANYDPDKNAHYIDMSFDYRDLRSVALNIKEGDDAAMDVDGKKMQVQFETEAGFISVSAWRSPPKVKPFDSRGAADAFELIKSKGVQEVASKGRVDVESPRGFTLIRR